MAGLSSHDQPELQDRPRGEARLPVVARELIAQVVVPGIPGQCREEMLLHDSRVARLSGKSERGQAAAGPVLRVAGEPRLEDRDARRPVAPLDEFPRPLQLGVDRRGGGLAGVGRRVQRRPTSG